MFDSKAAVLYILDDVLRLDGRAHDFSDHTPLLGSIPELDSIAVVTILTTLEEQLGFIVEDDELDGETFLTLGSLVKYVNSKLD